MPTLTEGERANVTRNQVRINADADGDNTVVAAVAGRKIRVISYMFTAGAAGIVSIKSGANILAEIDLAAKGGASFAGSYDGFAFETNAGEALIINNPAGVDTNGHLVYVLV